MAASQIHRVAFRTDEDGILSIDTGLDTYGYAKSDFYRIGYNSTHVRSPVFQCRTPEAAWVATKLESQVWQGIEISCMRIGRYWKLRRQPPSFGNIVQRVMGPLKISATTEEDILSVFIHKIPSKPPSVYQGSTLSQILSTRLATQQSTSKVVATIPPRVWICSTRHPEGEGPEGVPVDEASIEELEHHLFYFGVLDRKICYSVQDSIAVLRADLPAEERERLSNLRTTFEEEFEAEFECSENKVTAEDRLNLFSSVEEWLDACVESESKTLTACQSEYRIELGYRTDNGEVLAVRLVTLKQDLYQLQHLKPFIKTPSARQQLGDLLVRERQWRSFEPFIREHQKMLNK